MRLIIQSDISRFITAVTESCAIIGGIQLMKCQVIPVNIQNPLLCFLVCGRYIVRDDAPLQPEKRSCRIADADVRGDNNRDRLRPLLADAPE